MSSLPECWGLIEAVFTLPAGMSTTLKGFPSVHVPLSICKETKCFHLFGYLLLHCPLVGVAADVAGSLVGVGHPVKGSPHLS